MEKRKLTYEEKITRLKTQGVEISTMTDAFPQMKSDFQNGKERGSSTYVKGLDDAWTWRMGEFNIWTGYANEGKSQFLRFLALIKSLEESTQKNVWRNAFYAPEDYPPKEFFDDLIHTMAGRSTDKTMTNVMSEDLYEATFQKIKDFFYFVYIRPPLNTFEMVLKSFIPLIKEKKIKACIIDPLIKIARPPEYMHADDKFAAYVTSIATDFTRVHKTSVHLVIHQLTPRLTESGLYPKPNMYYIKGGGTWADGSDNILSLQRPQYAKDKVDDVVVFTSQKIKKQKLVGIPQDFEMRFNRRTNRYVDFATGNDLYNFGKHLGNHTGMRLSF